MSGDPLTILQLTASGDTAGATRSIIELCLGLARRGNRVVLGARPESHIFATLSKAGIETEPVAFRRKLSLKDARRVAAIAAGCGAHVVNAHASKDRYAAISARLLFGMRARLVVTRRVMPSSDGGALQGWFYARGSDRIVAVSEAVKEALVRRGIPRGHVTTIPNGLPPTRFPRGNPGRDAALMAELGLPPGRPVVGVVSRLKDQSDLLRALQHLARPVSVLFVGIKRVAELERLEAKLAGRHEVRYVEFAWDVLPYYGLLDLSVLPSRIEGLSQTLLESMSLGIPTIASRAGGNTDVIRHGENGLLFDPGDATGLAAELERLLGDDVLRDRVRSAAIHTATEEFSLARTIERTERLYRDLLAGRQPPVAAPPGDGGSRSASIPS